MENNTGLQEYQGNCHCGLFQFKLHIAKLTTVWTCSCSICSRNGYLWIFPVPENRFVIETGTEKALHAYEFAMRGTRHLFCPECGSSVLARRREAPRDQSLRINARMLEGVDLTTLEVKRFSGADAGPKYEPAVPAPPQETPKEVEKKLYHGNCHCGAFKYSVRIPELKDVIQCNCSKCTRSGALGKWPVAVDDVVVEKGEGSLKVYQFGGKVADHLFCPTCGSYIMGKRNDLPLEQQININVRMLKDVDIDSLQRIPFDGATIIGSKYVPPVIPGHKGEVEDGLRVYNGNCHCGAVSYTVKTKPLEEQKVMNCNCSLCSRNGDHFIYPPTSNAQLHGKENLTEYFFVSSHHSFCKICGTSVVVLPAPGGDSDVIPINVRTINGIDLSALEYQKYNGKEVGEGPPYEV